MCDSRSWAAPHALAAALLALALLAAPLGAQSRFGVGGRVGRVLATTDGAQPREAIDLAAYYTPSPRLSLYGAWSAASLGRSKVDLTLDVSGWSAGVEVALTTPRPGRVSPWVRGGVGAYQAYSPDWRSYGTGHQIGFDLGAGVLVPRSQRWGVNPALRVTTFGTSRPYGTAGTKLDLGWVSYVVADLGIVYHFGAQGDE